MKLGSINSLSYLPVKGNVFDKLIGFFARQQTKDIFQQHEFGVTCFDVCIGFDSMGGACIIDPYINISYKGDVYNIFDELSKMEDDIYVNINYKLPYDYLSFRIFLDNAQRDYPKLKFFGGECLDKMRKPLLDIPEELNDKIIYTENYNFLLAKLFNRREYFDVLINRELLNPDPDDKNQFVLYQQYI